MRSKIGLGLVLSLTPLAALAHVTLADNTAAPGAHYVAHIRVGHGCSGTPTTGLKITIPAGVSDVEPFGQPGWTPQKIWIAGRLGAVAWTGGPLDAKTPGEFQLALTLPAKPGPLVLAATQTCTGGIENWSDVPAPGQKSEHPAPVLYVGVPAPKPDGGTPGMVMPDGSKM